MKTNLLRLFYLGFLGALCYFFGLGVSIVAAILMAARVPDLVWEIKHGKGNLEGQPPIYMVTGLLTWASLPALWYAIYYK